MLGSILQCQIYNNNNLSLLNILLGFNLFKLWSTTTFELLDIREQTFE